MYSSITTGAVHGIDSYLIRVETEIGGVIYRAYSPLFRLLPEQNAG